MRPHHPLYEDRSRKPDIVAILLTIAFIIAVISAADILFLDLDAFDFEGEVDEEIDDEIDEEMFDTFLGIIETALTVCGILLLAIGVILLIGAVFAFKRMYWAFVLMASIFGIFTFGPFCMGTLLSIAALVLVIMSKDEFDRETETFSNDAYIPQAPPGYRLDRTCSECGGPMRYDEGFRMWYCDKCSRYK